MNKENHQNTNNKNHKPNVVFHHQPNPLPPNPNNFVPFGPISKPPMVLTKNIISSMISGEIFRYPRICTPIVDVFHINNISNNKQNSFSYCIVIFDGIKRAPVFVDNSLNGFLGSGLITKGSIIKLLDYQPFISNHLK